jgi:hypothetical protein
MEILKSNWTVYSNSVQQRDVELAEFQCWILERKNWNDDLNIIRQEELDKFLKSKDEDRELDIIYIELNDFYNEFEQLLGIYDFDESFVSAKYIDKMENSINLIVNVNGIEQTFRVDVA